MELRNVDPPVQKIWTAADITEMLANEVRYKDWKFVVSERAIMDMGIATRVGDVVTFDSDLRLRAEWMGADAGTGKLEKQQSRWWPLSKHMVKTEIIQTAFLCVLKAEEHEIRETFQYFLRDLVADNGGYWTAPFNSHIHIDTLAAASNEVDVRIDTRPEAPANQRRE